MRKLVATALLSLLLVMSQMSMPVCAATPDSSYADVDLTYPLFGGVIGGAGTLLVLVGMSKTKSKATHADHSIDLEKSVITNREDRHIRTDKRKKSKK